MSQPEDFLTNASSIHIAPPKQFSRDFLQTIVDALPEALAVIDRDYNVVLANRAARLNSHIFDVNSQSFKCFNCFHHRTSPCAATSDPFEGEHGACPLQRVIETKLPTRVYHTHYDEEQREVSVAVDAAPIFDAAGEVRLIIETCRDVTERCLSRRLCRIGNRHMEMKPLLEEYEIDISKFARCDKVRIHVLDEECAICSSDPSEVGAESTDSDNSLRTSTATKICMRHLRRELGDELPPVSVFGSLRFNRFSEFLSGLPDATRNRLAACTWPEYESVALVPIRLNEVDLGLLHVADSEPDAISEELVESLERLSLDLGAAIDRVRAEEALQTARNELETRVRERTEELTESNRALHNEITERVRLEREILQTGVTEQQRIGQELHDGVGQELTGIGYLAQNLLVSLKDQESSGVEMAAELARAIPTVLGQIQQIVRGLIPLEIGAADLELALEVLTANMAKQTGIAFQFSATGCDSIDDDDIPIQIYRIAQEAIANAVKHSDAQCIDVTLKANDEAIRLSVRDDGIGILSDAEDQPGSGLRSMRYRARAIGGEVAVRQRSSGGTIVECLIPQTPPPLPEIGKRNHES